MVRSFCVFLFLDIESHSSRLEMEQSYETCWRDIGFVLLVLRSMSSRHISFLLAGWKHHSRRRAWSEKQSFLLLAANHKEQLTHTVCSTGSQLMVRHHSQRRSITITKTPNAKPGAEVWK